MNPPGGVNVLSNAPLGIVHTCNNYRYTHYVKSGLCLAHVRPERNCSGLCAQCAGDRMSGDMMVLSAEKQKPLRALGA
eukprot:SAG22_NODE_20_length_32168_cov_40.859241_4_plen_78_part_00